jgi:hypothetical protein
MPDDEMSQTQILPGVEPATPDSLHLFCEPPGTLRVTVGDRYSYLQAKLYQSAPLSAPGRYLSLLSGKGEEIALVPSFDDLTPASREVAQAELRRRYLTATVQAIRGLRTEFGVTYWTVDTDRGTRDFVVQNLSESCVWISDRHLLLIDVDGNRFEIPDRQALDSISRARLDAVL